MANNQSAHQKHISDKDSAQKSLQAKADDIKKLMFFDDDMEAYEDEEMLEQQPSHTQYDTDSLASTTLDSINDELAMASSKYENYAQRIDALQQSSYEHSSCEHSPDEHSLYEHSAQENSTQVSETMQGNTSANSINDSSADTKKLYSEENLAGLTPTAEFNTAEASPTFYVPTLPKPINADSKRQLILDTETTGLDALNGDRIIEIGAVEVINRKFTGEKLHVYIDPQRAMDPEAVAVHGITPEFLAGKPKFADIADRVLAFLEGAEIIAHNAPFDIGFLNAEFAKVGVKNFDAKVKVTDSLALAKAKYPGQKNSLDALVKRLEIITKDRSFHGALLDAEILADVYLTMTGGQVALDIGESASSLAAHKQFKHAFAPYIATEAENTEHETWLMDMATAKDNPDFLTAWSLPLPESMQMDDTETSPT